MNARIQRFVGRCLAGVLFLVLPWSAVLAQSYPERPVQLLVGFPPGQATDVLARLIATHLHAELGQNVVVENRPGAGGTTAVAAGARAKPDGHVLAMTSAGPHSIAPSLYPKLPYDPTRDFTPIGLVATIPQFVYAHPSFPASSVAELLAHAKAQPQPLSYASSGNGLPGHIIMETIARRSQVALNHVPYKGSAPALTDVMGNQVPVGIDTAATVLPHHRAGKLKILGVASRKRTAVAPEVVPMAEQGLPGTDFTAWIGLVGPAGLPPDVTARLSAALGRILARPDVVRSISEMGMDPAPLASAEFREWIRTERARWAEAVQLSGAKAD
jgi:tripartite-type tricarboxylate transporter receptor subunit TctC